jgi:hypothetical protein
MSALLVEEASVSIPLLGAGLDESEMVRSPAISQAIKDALAALCGAAALRR